MYTYLQTNPQEIHTLLSRQNILKLTSTYIKVPRYLSGKYLEITSKNKFNYVTTKMINNFISDHFGLD